MTPEEKKLFVITALGMSFQLGFSSLLQAAATRRGRDALPWLSDFEKRVLSDVQRMTAGEGVPDAVVAETTDTIAAEFRQVFESVRAKISEAPSEGAPKAVRSRSGLAAPRLHSCGGG